ncbi:PepSY domain-containing protein [Bradyrhizobium tropiciagri]|uniref:PepSY domain-containing protein n=1 Tax=Bradyrhizobium tropiciagri TaxID=312253 RepID=UPI001BA709AD|nr:PepSY domain-containing protein [Bradyrhizobium tropiciagri]MBR0875327.1 PepSY domain-containing protein [Bradyrhizobium tropiciagri]
MLRVFAFVALAASLSTASVSAQTPPAQSGPNNNAVNSSSENNSNAPVAGRNSFTEGQAKSRIEAAGYSDVSDLKKDDSGVWRGKAKKGDKQIEVSLDFQGNVNPAN